MMGLFMELGPFQLTSGYPGGLTNRSVAWNDRHDVLFVDQPAGTGFSVARSDEGYARNQTQVGNCFVMFLRQFYGRYPAMQQKDLWLTGESYAGKYIPAIAAAILAEVPSPTAPGASGGTIPLRGLAIGNGLTRPREMTLSVPDSYYAVGILDQPQKERAAKLAADCVAMIDERNWTAATAARSVLFDYIDNANGPSSAPNVDNLLVYGECNESALSDFLNLRLH